MLYRMRCDYCKKELEIGCPISQHDSIIAPGIAHEGGCFGTFRQIIEAPRIAFAKEGFPKHGHEIALPTEHHESKSFRDKSEARDWLGERGLTSKWIENDV